MKPTIVFIFGILAPALLCRGTVTFVQTVGMGLVANAKNPNIMNP